MHILTLHSCGTGCITTWSATYILSSYNYSVRSVWVQWSSFSRGDTWTEHITVDKFSIRFPQWNADLQWVTGDSGKPFPRNSATVWDTWMVCIWTLQSTGKRLWRTCRVINIFPIKIYVVASYCCYQILHPKYVCILVDLLFRQNSETHY